MDPAGTDTIVAIATPPGRGGVGIVRLSGPAAAAIAASLVGELPRPRYAAHRAFRDAAGAVLDDGLVLYFPAPHSYTGEAVVELQGHGAPVVLDLIVARCVDLGARLARPGEFTERAFLNGRLDLAQAEAVADLIDSATEQAARGAQRSLQGEFSARIQALVDALIELRAYLEAAIDFPDEEVDILAEGQVAERLTALAAQLDAVQGAARVGSLLREGLTVVIAGRPNAGKSSLLNALAGFDAAIVTDVPGTTRDVLREHIHLDGIPLRILDTAGLRVTHDAVEQEGVRRAQAEVAHADHMVLVVDDSLGAGAPEQALLDLVPERPPLTVVYNKIDLSGRSPRTGRGELGTEVWLSARTGAGIDLLRAALKQAAGIDAGAGDGAFMARRRHLSALTAASAHIGVARRSLDEGAGVELVAENLRLAQLALQCITGLYTSDELLGEIFGRFCIGK
ncbi:tRNA uridine-5-carboxymethylaminomethyl(34) synthesis GTPase MnmE [Ectothiorhodospiraceae bacterium 2226]|nr:tRNA uridine-5-carboxymethylaminomethyl(34) synthesis GTPase MnmE [Ectothiorhodospiraceae bacterium 2226]